MCLTITPEIKVTTAHLLLQFLEERDPEPKESSRGNETAIKALETNVENPRQDLTSEEATNKFLQTEVEKLRQELDNERKSNGLMQKILTKKERANKDLETMKMGEHYSHHLFISPLNNLI